MLPKTYLPKCAWADEHLLLNKAAVLSVVCVLHVLLHMKCISISLILQSASAKFLILPPYPNHLTTSTQMAL